MVIRDVCPRCQSPKFKKNSHTHTGKQNHHCHDCGRQFVQCCEQYLISADKRSLIERLLVERISLRGYLSRGGCHPQVALGFSGPMLRGLAGSSPCPPRLLYPRCADPTAGGG